MVKRKVNLISNNKNPILITLHGGCFVGGSSSWDKAQTKYLEECGYIVHQLDFPKDNFNETIIYIHNYIKNNFECKVYLLGRSSGGYLAKKLFDNYPDLFKKVFYLAPVFNPKLRAHINTKFQSKQDHYFRNEVEIGKTDSFDENKEVLFLATNDENVPKYCFTKKQLDNAIYLGIKSHKGMTTTISKSFLEIMKSHMTNA